LSPLRVAVNSRPSYKRRIVREPDTCSNPGAVGALLRREGLYSSHLSNWRQEVEAIELAALQSKPRGPKPDAAHAAWSLFGLGLPDWPQRADDEVRVDVRNGQRTEDRRRISCQPCFPLHGALGALPAAAVRLDVRGRALAEGLEARVTERIRSPGRNARDDGVFTIGQQEPALPRLVAKKKLPNPGAFFLILAETVRFELTIQV
jgi:hypothetical protein